MVHGRCPINGSWDYYELDVQTTEFVKCEEIEFACDQVRGSELTQESIADELKCLLPSSCKLILQGRHGQNISTTIEI